MSGNIKKLLALLSLGAAASAFYLLSLLSPNRSAIADPVSLNAQSLGLLQADPDRDDDGIADSEESYWKTDFLNPDSDGDGFRDGEEVLSGHDPAKPGPDDWLDSSQNLTQRVTRLTAGGVLTGDLKPDSPTYDASVQRLADDIMEKYRQNTAVSVDDIILADRDDAQARNAYVVTMAWVLSGVFAPALEDAERFLSSVEDLTWSDPTPLTDDPKRVLAFATSARKLAQTTGERASEVASTEVPLAFAIQHKNAIKILRTLQRQYELVATIKDDPLQGMAALDAIIRLHTDTMPRFVADFGDAVAAKLSADAQR